LKQIQIFLLLAAPVFAIATLRQTELTPRIITDRWSSTCAWTASCRQRAAPCRT